MKRRLAILASSLVVGVGAIAVAPAQALPIFGTESHHELEDILDGSVGLDDDQELLLMGLSFNLGLSFDGTELLNNPEAMSGLYQGNSVDPNAPPQGMMVYSKGGCSVDAGCGLKAIGLMNTLKCAASGADPEAWARCLQDTDYDAYIAASACTWGSCPGFALTEDGIFACAEPTGLSVFATLN
ncbi:hypothetical protein NEA10_11620 [Phormidium yuhuli AB48]|uniref:Secreted protein n=1 Tax=Phormidium yuhuli AB48 TaxID=2940671 RepID=A0ABY5AKA8_9CYAN|nr:hypothetical protein [Phormidium yuhuli]USR89537.1 hypothetical protein NEA10_11620 [Phormidium yuhuli AB48]